jgi:predicted secreted protein
MPDESTILAHVGKPFSVELESIPSAGYQWRVEVDPDVIELKDRKRNPALALGGSLKEQFVFLPHKRGEFVIRMRYGRAWEPDSTTSRILNVRVT